MVDESKFLVRSEYLFVSISLLGQEHFAKFICEILHINCARQEVEMYAHFLYYESAQINSARIKKHSIRRN